MRTTVDIPDELLRRAKAAAALRGMKLKDLIASFVEQGLDRPPKAEVLGQRRSIPVAIHEKGQGFPALTNAEIEEMFLLEDVERLGLNRPA